MEQIEIVSSKVEYGQVRRLFGAYRRAVEQFATAAEVCA
jgi:hypothetical protein